MALTEPDETNVFTPLIESLHITANAQVLSEPDGTNVFTPLIESLHIRADAQV